jgi:succinyl-CoA synthetase beta subunit
LWVVFALLNPADQYQYRSGFGKLAFDNFNIVQDYGVTVQKFRMATNEAEAARIPAEFPCSEYVIKAQVLAGGRGKGHFDNGFKGGVHLTKDPAKVRQVIFRIPLSH